MTMTKTGDIRIGLRIKLARIERHMTQLELAQRSEISQAFLSLIESGDRTPSSEMVDQISRALGCDLEGEEW
jgi:transcriptional regulator with XRE-family HTH domain